MILLPPTSGKSPKISAAVTSGSSISFISADDCSGKGKDSMLIEKDIFFSVSSLGLPRNIFAAEWAVHGKIPIDRFCKIKSLDNRLGPEIKLLLDERREIHLRCPRFFPDSPPP